MTTPLRPGQSPERSISEKNLTTGASALRFVAAVVAVGSAVSTLMLWAHEVDSSGSSQRPFIGHGVAVASFGVGLCAILLFVASWADQWTEIQYTERIRRRSP